VTTVQSRFAETLIVTLTRNLTLTPNPNPNFGESNFGESGRHRKHRDNSVDWQPGSDLPQSQLTKYISEIQEQHADAMSYWQ